jgi:hypothetical protein
MVAVRASGNLATEKHSVLEADRGARFAKVGAGSLVHISVASNN